MPLPAPPYADYPARLLALQAQAAQAYADHATRPSVQGTFEAYLKRWVAAYEAAAALREENPAWAGHLLPTGSGAAQATASPTGLPLVPAGVLAEVDVPRRGVVKVTVDISASAGSLAASVALYGSTAPAVASTVFVLPTRATLGFAAPVDGIYAVTLSVSGAPLATLYVLVCRQGHRLLREDSRALGFTFDALLPRPSPVLLARLARLAAAEAACRTGQPDLATRLVASALALPAAPTPTALFPRPRHA